MYRYDNTFKDGWKICYIRNEGRFDHMKCICRECGDYEYCCKENNIPVKIMNKYNLRK